jgi:predicted small lipoprotein YifL
VAVLAVAVGTLATVTGCATKGTLYATPESQAASSSSIAIAPTSTTGPLPTASMTPLPAAAGQLTGTDLESVLLPASYFPPGFTASSSAPVTSGGTLTSAAALYPLGTVSCSEFVQHLGSTGFGETGMAADSVVGTDQAYDQVIYQFATASEASAFVAGIQPLASRCTSFTAPASGGTTAKFSLKAAAGSSVAGQPTVELAQTGTVSGSALALDTLFSASGVDVFAASGVGLGIGAPAVPAKETMIYDLMKRQIAAAELG